MYWTFHHTTYEHMDRYGWLKYMIQFSNVCGASPVNNKIIFFDGHDTHFNNCSLIHIYHQNTQPFTLVPQDLDILCRKPKGNKLRSKTWSLNCVLEFTVPSDRRNIDIYDNSRMRPPICQVYCMIGIHISLDHKIITKVLQHMPWNDLMSIRVSVFPIVQISFKNSKHILICQFIYRVVCHPPWFLTQFIL